MTYSLAFHFCGPGSKPCQVMWYLSKSKVEVTLRLTVSKSVCLGIEYPCGTCDQILFPVRMLLSEICGLVSIERPLWREDGSAIYSVITQWSVLLRTRNNTILSHLRFPQPGVPGSRIYIPQEQGGPVIHPGTGLQYLWWTKQRFLIIFPPTTSRSSSSIFRDGIIGRLEVNVLSGFSFTTSQAIN
jgi:hypothetical protein